MKIDLHTCDGMVLNGCFKVTKRLKESSSSLVVEAQVLSGAVPADYVAIKILDSNLYDVGLQESKILKTVLSRINTDQTTDGLIVKYYGHFTHEKYVCLVLELLGPSIFDLHIFSSSSRRSCTIRDIQNYSRRIFQTLQLLHNNGFVHADVKPENILTKHADDSSSTMLIDYGNSVHMSQISVYEDDFAIQTLRYRAPEVLFGLGITCEIDIWSAGLCLAELCYGGHVFEAQTPQALISEWNTFFGGAFEIECFSTGVYFDEYASIIDSLPSDSVGGPVLRSSQSLDKRKVIPKTTTDNTDRGLIAQRSVRHEKLKAALRGYRDSPMTIYDDLCDLIASCLCFNPNDRVTAIDALNHSFLSKKF